MKRRLDPREYRRKWGIPDWRDEKAYPTKLTDTGRRWEFLRRRDDYRRDWETWADKIRKFREWNRDPKNTAWSEMLRLAHNLREAFSKYDFAIFGPQDPSVRNLKEVCFEKNRPDCGKWYSALRAGFLYTQLNPWVLEADAKPKRIYPHVLLQNHCLFVFDMTKPISPQIRRAEKTLLEEQRLTQKRIETARLHRDKFACYLRALDAEAEHATYSEISEVLFPRSRRRGNKGEETVKAAHAIQDLLTDPI